MSSQSIANGVSRERILELSLQYHDHRIHQICWTTSTPPYNAVANKDRLISVVVGIQNFMNDMEKEYNNNKKTQSGGNNASERSMAAIQHNVIVALCEVKETKMPLHQVLTSLISLLYKRRLVAVEDEIRQLIDFDVNEGSLWLLYNITIVLTAISTFAHIDIAYRLLRKLHLWLLNENRSMIDSSSGNSSGASSSSSSLFADDSLQYMHLRVLLSLIHLDIRIREHYRSWQYLLSSQHEEEHLEALQHCLTTSNNILKLPQHASSPPSSQVTLWRLFLQYNSHSLELVKIKRLILEFQHHQQQSSNAAKKQQMMAGIEESLAKLTEIFKTTLSAIHGATLAVEINEEIHCNLLFGIHDFIGDIQHKPKPSPSLGTQTSSSSSTTTGTFLVGLKLSGNKFIVKLNLMRVYLLITKQNYSEAQSLLQSMLPNCDNEHDQAAILNNITLFRPWSGPYGLADLTYHKSLSYQLDHRRIFGRIQCNSVNMSRIIYNIALTQMKASRFCESYYLLAMLALINEHEFARNPLYFLRLGECCVQYHRITATGTTFPRYYVKTSSSNKRKYYALIHEENNVNQSQIDLEKQLEEIAQPYQISSCNLTSARKYLSTAFFFAESATTGNDLITRRICENIMFVCARLQDPCGVQFYGNILQQKGLHVSEVYSNSMAKAYLDQGKVLQCISELQNKLANIGSAQTSGATDTCQHSLTRNQVIFRDDLKLADPNNFVKLLLLSNSILASSQSLNSNQTNKLDEILKQHPTFVPAWSMKFLQAVDNKNVDALNSYITSYSKVSL